MNRGRTARRDFLKAAGLAAAAPYFWTTQPAKAQLSANDKLGVGCIGVGGRGSGIGNDCCRRAGVKVAVADVDLSHAERFAGGDSSVKIYQDYRKLLEHKDIDIVTIGTPDHWHVKIAIEALQAGKHVYCEKPLTLTIDEGKKLREVVKQSGKVFQVGTQQRSDGRFLLAVAMARSGRLGRPLKATCSIGGGPTGGPFPTSDPPPQLNWDMWLGQCPVVPYTRERCHGSFRWWLEYSGGKLTDWGAHHVDIAHWGLGHEDNGPIEIEGQGTFPNIPDDFDPVAFFAGKLKLPNGYNTATQFHVDLRFADGSLIHVQHGPDNGIWFEGDKDKLYKGKPRRGHMQNFIDCVREGGEPVSDVASHHRELSSCHLCNIAMLLKRKLRWDPVKEEFVGDEQANALLSRPQRAPYTINV